MKVLLGRFNLATDSAKLRAPEEPIHPVPPPDFAAKRGGKDSGFPQVSGGKLRKNFGEEGEAVLEG